MNENRKTALVTGAWSGIDKALADPWNDELDHGANDRFKAMREANRE